MFSIVVLASGDSPYATVYECVVEGVFGEKIAASSASWGTRLVDKSDLFATREDAERGVVDRLRADLKKITAAYEEVCQKFCGVS